MTNVKQFRSLEKDENTYSFVAWASTLTVIFLLTLSVTPPMQAQTYQEIHAFTGQGGDGLRPIAGVTARGGVLYGTTQNGGLGSGGGVGTAYQITHVGNTWTTAPIFLFPADASGGAYPDTKLIFGPDGHPYGTAPGGGGQGNGVVFDLVPPLSICKTVFCPWKENVVYSFAGGTDGAWPTGDLTFDPQGNIYGTTKNGGAAGLGTVYQLTKAGSTWTEKTIYSFLGGSDGVNPMGGVIFDDEGNLFGTTYGGGLYGYGTVFELAYLNGAWVESVVFNFQDDLTGGHPVAGLLLVPPYADLYGATTTGGLGFYGPTGTIFGGFRYGQDYSFGALWYPDGPVAGPGPLQSLSLDANGLVHGTDQWSQDGEIFTLGENQNRWYYSSDHPAECPCSEVTIDTDGTLYGTASYGGSQRYGVVWQIKP